MKADRKKIGPGRWLGHCVQTTLAIIAAFGLVATAYAKDYGKPGEPIDLTVGYQPYYTQAWQAVVLKYGKFWEKYLPKGSTVSWKVGLQGTIVGNGMLAEKNDIGYMGDMPSILTVSKRQVLDIRIVAVLGLAADQCSVILTPVSAPKFDDMESALKWLNGKRVAVAKGSCTDRTFQLITNKYDLEPAAYLNQNIEVQYSGLKAGRIDGSVMWEPTAAKMVLDGVGRPIASAAAAGSLDGGFLAMPKDLIDQRPDVVKGWLQAELDADLFILDPENVTQIVEWAEQDTEGFSKEVLWMSLVGRYPESAGGAEFRDIKYFGFNEDVLEMISNATKFLYESETISVEQLPEGTVMPEFTAEILKERGLEVPVGRVPAKWPSEYPGGGIELGHPWKQ